MADEEKKGLAYREEQKSTQPEKVAKEQQSEKKIPVYIVSNSLTTGLDIVNLNAAEGEPIGLKPKPGGLAAGIASAFPKDGPYEMARWFATSKEYLHPDTGEVNEILHKRIRNSLNKNKAQLLFLPKEKQETWYSSTNDVYWPLLHGLTDHVTDTNKSKVYEEVNKQMADTMIQSIKDENKGEIPKDAMVWVQDYHFNSVIKHLKEQAPDLKVGYFLHVPFPEIDTTMSNNLAQHMEGIKTSLESLSKADSIGFHTAEDRENFIKTLEHLGIVATEEQKQEIQEKTMVNPIGIPKALVTQNYDNAMYAQANDRVIFSSLEGEYEGWEKVDGDLDPINILNKKTKDWIKNKESHAKGDMEFSLEKIHIGSLSRWDYTKGIHELFTGYLKFLQDKRAQGMKKPGEKYQLNVVASPPRELQAFKDYQQEALKIAHEILTDFPGSLNYIPGIPNEELPLFFSAMHIQVATSLKDGYILAVGEGLIAKTRAMEDGMLPRENRPTGVILSTGAGIARSLEKDADGQVNIPPALSIIEPSVHDISEALYTQVGRVEDQLAYLETNVPQEEIVVNPTLAGENPALDTFSDDGREDPDLYGDYYKLADRLEDTNYFGKKALDHLAEHGKSATGSTGQTDSGDGGDLDRGAQSKEEELSPTHLGMPEKKHGQTEPLPSIAEEVSAGENIASEAQVFNATLVTTILATDSDGTVVAANEDQSVQVPPPAFVETMRQKSLEDPSVAIAIISGRADAYLQEHYGPALSPDEEGRVPKILLLSENGAFLRASTDAEQRHTLTEPFTEELRGAIEHIVREAAGEHFREDDQNLDPNEVSIWLDPKETTYGIFRRTPDNGQAQEQMQEILEQIGNELAQLNEQHPDLHIKYDAVDAFLVEKVSKGITVEDLANGKESKVLQETGLAVGKIQSMTYHGDDVADIPAQNAVNEMLLNRSLESGHTSRINDYSPHFSTDKAVLLARTAPKSPKDARAQDSFYVLGSNEVSPQEQHQQEFLDQTAVDQRNTLREALSTRNLLPSQSGDKETPPIVLLTTGDLLIQEPERYRPEALQGLESWTEGKVVLVDNENNWDISDTLNVLGNGNNDNLMVTNPQGELLKAGQVYDLSSQFTDRMSENEIISASPDRSSEIQLLRTLQETLVSAGLIANRQQAQERPEASLTETPLVTGGLAALAAIQQTPVRPPTGMAALAVTAPSTAPTVGETATEALKRRPRRTKSI